MLRGNWCEANGVIYLIGLAGSEPLPQTRAHAARGRERRGHPRLRRDHSPCKELESRAPAPSHASQRLGSARRALCHDEFHPQLPAHRLPTLYCHGLVGHMESSQHPPATGIDRRSDWGQHSLISPETAPSNVSPKFRSDPRPTGLDRLMIPSRQSLESLLGTSPPDWTKPP